MYWPRLSDGSQLEAALTGGNQSSLAGSYLKIMASNQTSKNGKDYLSFSYAKPEEAEVATPAVATTVAPTAITAAPEASAAAAVEDLPDFDM